MPDRRSLLDWSHLVLVTLLSPLLLFPRLEWMWVGLLIPLLWALDYCLSGRLMVQTPLNLPLLLLFLTMMLSSYATYDLRFSLPKLAGALLGYSLLFGIARWADRPFRLGLAAAGWCAAGLALALVSLVGTDWKAKFSVFQGLPEWLPTRLTGLPGAAAGFNANAVGGTLILFLPLLLFVGIKRGQAFPQLKQPARRSLQAAVWAAFGITAATVLISQSRGAWMGIAAASWTLGCLRFSWLRRLSGVALIAAACTLLIWSPWQLVGDGAGPPSDPDAIGLEARFEIWSRAVYTIEDFPITGVGMDNFRKVVPELYPLFRIPPDKDIASAHNHILQAAAELGLPGMVAYMAFWSALLRMLWQSARCGHHYLLRLLAAGMGCGLLAQFFFQMTDAIPLGAKAGIFFWIAAGLTAALWRLSGAWQAMQPWRWSVSPLDIVLGWLLASSISVALMGRISLLGLAVGIAGGAMLGWLTPVAFDRFGRAQPHHEDPWQASRKKIVSSGFEEGAR